jgi:hypothetical protein
LNSSGTLITYKTCSASISGQTSGTIIACYTSSTKFASGTGIAGQASGSVIACWASSAIKSSGTKFASCACFACGTYISGQTGSAIKSSCTF